MEYRRVYQSPVGILTLVSDGEHLTGLDFHGGGNTESPAKCGQTEKLSVFERTGEWLDIYFGGGRPDFMPPLRFSGTPFRMAVWNILKTIPYGETMTYGEIAGQIAKQRGIARMSAQAVGGAVGHNPIGILVPCHRVMGAGGNLTGFGGGIETKIKLLALEGIDTTKFFCPRRG